MASPTNLCGIHKRSACSRMGPALSAAAVPVGSPLYMMLRFDRPARVAATTLPLAHHVLSLGSHTHEQAETAPHSGRPYDHAGPIQCILSCYHVRSCERDCSAEVVYDGEHIGSSPFMQARSNVLMEFNKVAGALVGREWPGKLSR
jgi:hypothetical protein